MYTEITKQCVLLGIPFRYVGISWSLKRCANDKKKLICLIEISIRLDGAAL